METIADTISLIYTTTKRKKIHVYFAKNCEAWIVFEELKTLFDLSDERIREITDTCSGGVGAASISLPEYFNFPLVVEIGKHINRIETEELVGWYQRMTQEHSLCISTEFNLYLSKMLNSQQNG
jgi:hypothetical protein